MILTLRRRASAKDVDRVVRRIRDLGYRPHISRGVDVTIIGMIGERAERHREAFEAMDAVDHISEIEKPYKLASREFRGENTVIDLGSGVSIGGSRVPVMAGPCAVESREGLFEAAAIVRQAGAAVLRGGAFKPRSSPYTFQGLGERGLRYLSAAHVKFKMPVITEVMAVEQAALVCRYCDIVQIGARNVQNYDLLKEVGRHRRPVLLKRGMATTIKELLLSAEYIMAQGNYRVMICERGIRTFEDATRFTLDLNAVPVLKKLTHLPVVVDPSHGVGIREHVPVMAKAALAAGADGLIIEVHPRPEEALSDGPQSLLPAQFTQLMSELKTLARALGREI